MVVFLAVVAFMYVLVPNVSADNLNSTNFKINTGIAGNSLGTSQGSTNYGLVSSGGESVIGSGAGGSFILGQGYTSQLAQSLQLSVQPSGLLAYYSLDEGANKVAHDSSSNNYHTVFNGTPTWSSGVLNGAITTSSGNYLSTANDPSVSYTAITACAWSNITSTSTTPGIISHSDDTISSSGMWSLGYGSSSSTPRVYFNLGGTVYQVASSVSVGTGNWAHICMTYDGGDIVLYVNGVKMGSQTVNVALSAPTAPFSIGARGTIRQLNGQVDEAKIYSRALSASEIMAEYDAQQRGKNSGIGLGTITLGTSSKAGFDSVVQTDAPGYNLAVQQDDDLRKEGTGASPDFSQNFNSFGHGTTLTAGSTGFDNSTSNGTATYVSSTTSPLHSTYARITSTTSSTYILRKDQTSVASRYYRFYVRMSAIPSSTQTILASRNGSTAVSNIRIQNDGTLSIRDGTSTVDTSTVTITANQWARLELHYDSAGAKQWLRIFLGDNVDGQIPDQVLSGSATNGSTDNFQAGLVTAQTSQTYDLDDIATSTAGWLGPAGTDTIPAISSGTISSPVTWNEGTTKGLGFTLASAPSLDSKWGGGTKYAAFPGTSTSVYARSGYTGGTKDTIGMEARLDVASTQALGSYRNTITLVGTMTP